MGIAVEAHAESWRLAAPFTISRGAKSSADVVIATAREGGFAGRGEAVPYPRYAESVAGALDTIRTFARERGQTLSRGDLRALPAGAARNALDCALWDLAAKRTGRPVWRLAGLAPPASVVTAYTIGLGSVPEMRRNAARNATRPLLKIKLGRAPEEDVERLRAVRDAAPATRLIVDANEGWTMAGLELVAPVAAELGVELIEQPLPAGADAALSDWEAPVPLGADESLHGDGDPAGLSGKYDVLNVKLDKTGGLSAALELVERARGMGFGIMIGCMVATSLSMAPALLLARGAAFVDLDGPLLLAADRPDGLRYEDDRVAFPPSGGWGQP